MRVYHQSDDVSCQVPTFIMTFTVCAAQGLADVDPDVDAIYRLTQPLNISFARNTPSVVLPRGIMAPFNSQNTLFDRDALWGLLIPVTTTFRCDGLTC